MTPGVDTMAAPWPEHVPGRTIAAMRAQTWGPSFVSLTELVERARRRRRARQTHPGKR